MQPGANTKVAGEFFAAKQSTHRPGLTRAVRLRAREMLSRFYRKPC
jgi:hypothetical protein